MVVYDDKMFPSFIILASWAGQTDRGELDPKKMSYEERGIEPGTLRWSEVNGMHVDHRHCSREASGSGFICGRQETEVTCHAQSKKKSRSLGGF
jgi:hypothetical protein